MNNTSTKTLLALIAMSALSLATPVVAAEITPPTYFDGLDATIINFEAAPGGGGTLPDHTDLTNLYAAQGVTFSSEMTPQSGAYDAPMRILAAVSGGGAPTSGARYAGGWIFAGFDTSSYRIDFAQPVDAFAMYIIDNDFSAVLMSAYDHGGALIESIVVPITSEGGFSYHGIAAAGIDHVIITDAAGNSLDSTFIDDLTFLTGPCSDGTVDVADLLLLLSQWGPCDPDCIMDLDNNLVIDVADLLGLLAAWGECV